ncbi:SMP-30/gluconolactonase/LRE family protein [Streptomyces anulatus]|uniref:SMP-30/gluconolactonase/LRE family protein n=1 Tax=Streptomyces anulatus TaxID=1892 RepID=UPI0022541A27|nr:SMP-30/gluconolactonase/LRE family protein [Streptomyces anulatus]MCX4489953.1 SMP-30/gluconolactonase/LRE family protein [Streptomyces anulatus]
MRHLRARPCSPPPGRLCEGPVWDPDLQELLWVDITAGLIHRGSLIPCTDGSTLPDVRPGTVLAPGGPVGAVLPSRSGALIAAVSTSLLRLTGGGHAEELAALPIPLDGVQRRLNDAACDPRGRLLTGTMAYDTTEGAGSLYQFGPDGLRVLLDSVTISNGLGWSPDGSLMYYADSPTGRVDVFDYDLATGTPGSRRPFASIDGGVPDGLTVDRDGNVWVAVWGAGQIRAFAPDGTCHTVVDVGASHVSSVAFAGPGLDILVITTATEELTEQQSHEERHAGRLFVCRPGIPGLVATPFNDLVPQETA